MAKKESGFREALSLLFILIVWIFTLAMVFAGLMDKNVITIYDLFLYVVDKWHLTIKTIMIFTTTTIACFILCAIPLLTIMIIYKRRTGKDFFNGLGLSIKYSKKQKS